jgi:hypothetical protein
MIKLFKKDTKQFINCIIYPCFYLLNDVDYHSKLDTINIVTIK